MAFALTGARVFDGAALLAEQAVIVDGAWITAVLPVAELPARMVTQHLAGGMLVPGFIDVQVNGGGGVLLNDSPAVAAIRHIAAAHRRHGVTGLLPTVITDAPPVLAAAMAAVRAARAAGVPGVLGLHVEGPFLDPERRGAHDARFIRSLTEADVAQLAAADCGILLLTLAPNRVPPEMIARLVARGIRVSLGHAAATAAEAQAALNAGATAFTHLFNAMSQMTGRAPGMVGAALASAGSFCGLIADGFHVDDTAMRAAFAALGPDRLMLISDAMPPAAGGPARFLLQGRAVNRVDGRLELDDGTLAGSDLTLDAAVRHCVRRLAIPLAAALRMASATPAAMLGRGNDLGRIAPGFLASLVHLDDDLQVRQTWIDGR